jgi:hypothetical protein
MQGEGVSYGDEDDDMLFRDLTNDELDLPFGGRLDWNFDFNYVDEA